MFQITGRYVLFLTFVFFSFEGVSTGSQKHSALQTQPALQNNYALEVITEAIPIPWGMVQLPNGDLVITERTGHLYLLNAKTRKIHEIKGLPEIKSGGQGGLLDLALHPEYSQNGWLYFSYVSPKGKRNGTNTAIMRAKLDGLVLTQQTLLYKAAPNSERRLHFGGRLVFDKQGYLYFSIGDRGERDLNPQDIQRDGGKIYRLHDDGRIPKDNPFADKKGVRNAIYSYGHRNPQGLALNPFSGAIWEHEHGPQGGDEINLIQAGKNYGWPVVSHGINYDGSSFTDLTEKEGMESPIWHWTPSIAPSGMAFVNSSRYPDWQGDLLVGSLKFNRLILCRIENQTVVSQEIVFDDIGRVRTVVQMPDGYIYVATENNAIFRVIRKN